MSDEKPGKGRLSGLRPPFPKGHSGNPNGRPKGSRNKLGEVFLEALATDFDAHGVEAIRQCRETDPVQYVKVVAGLLPREMKIQTRRLEQLTTDELVAILRDEEDGTGEAEALH